MGSGFDRSTTVDQSLFVFSFFSLSLPAAAVSDQTAAAATAATATAAREETRLAAGGRARRRGRGEQQRRRGLLHLMKRESFLSVSFTLLEEAGSPSVCLYSQPLSTTLCCGRAWAEKEKGQRERKTAGERRRRTRVDFFFFFVSQTILFSLLSLPLSPLHYSQTPSPSSPHDCATLRFSIK